MRLRPAAGLTAALAASVVASSLSVTASAGPVMSETTRPHPTLATAKSQLERRHEVIAWSQFVDVRFSAARIVASGPHGGHLHAVTHPAEGVVDVNPEISPDGHWIAFERDLEDTSRIIIVGIHGHRQHALDLGCVDPCLGDSGPTWAPDGRHLFFQRAIGPIGPDDNAASAALWRTDLAGDHVVRVSPERIDGRYEDNSARVAPAGYVVFIRLSLRRDSTALFRMRPDGSHARRLTPWRLSADIFDVSPARRGPTRNLVTFETYGHVPPPDGTTSAVAAVSAVLHKDRRVQYLTSPTSVPVWHFNPTWSPNGRRVAFVRFKSVNSDPIVHGDIWTIRWDGTDRERISHGRLFDFRPSWGRVR
jgi:Tol biopolymer transport system component